MFLEVLRGTAESGILVIDDAHYDVGWGVWRAKSAAAEVPESIAKMGLGRARRVSVAPSIWNSYVPHDLLLVYRKHVPHYAANKGAHALHRAPSACHVQQYISCY